MWDNTNGSMVGSTELPPKQNKTECLLKNLKATHWNIFNQNIIFRTVADWLGHLTLKQRVPSLIPINITIIGHESASTMGKITVLECNLQTLKLMINGVEVTHWA